MRRPFTAAALVVPIIFAGGTAVAAPQSSLPASVKMTSKAAMVDTVMTGAVLPEKLAAPGPNDVCNYTDFRPTLRQGSSGNAVEQAQCYLNYAINAGLDEDGDFGPATAAATREFQRCAEIVVDGRIGAQTWSFLVFWANAADAPFC
ncbi:peptidoglycan-binding protein [Streptomyces sp. NBC_01799]|uniref:peptidoglycan-binding domain-containing protein n=1 Tax=Streptomyces sp. NBC_01800 TaxID=2975945 RepID=UPI002DDB5D79|nr:peptidoglycan-binding domain-containing protein [Streptomyces sp. NBC_01800]WSA65692.1 peptidoglycan-binding protein [Streptomyces sp. NBC_01800]WSA73425.1 peptidoglycan-binding protein [Streptomyces sp. NBC_01800]WSA74297.1 peptidoglycan-binding protein [Streptomyces sp. NBC_01799]WSA81950.1 peptidoglycan-binding protein [Streptomyces sp. NBC_01799]